MTREIVVVGASAAGLRAAALIRRGEPDSRVVVYEGMGSLEPPPRSLIVTDAFRRRLGAVGEPAIVNEIRRFELFAAPHFYWLIPGSQRRGPWASPRRSSTAARRGSRACGPCVASSTCTCSSAARCTPSTRGTTARCSTSSTAPPRRPWPASVATTRGVS